MSVILAYFIVGQVTYIEELIYLFVHIYIAHNLVSGSLTLLSQLTRALR